MGLVLYELAAADSSVRFSPHCWKSRMALAHKGLEAERRPWRFVDKGAIAFSGQGRVPVLVDGETVVSDSWSIAEHLEDAYPERPSLFGGPEARATTRFVNDWADAVLLPAIVRLIVADIHGILAPQDQAYFRETREQRFGRPLEEVSADREAAVQGFRKLLAPLRAAVRRQDFLSGETPRYYCVFGHFMWADCVTDFQLLEPGDPVASWRERLLDAFDGLPRKAPRARPAAA
jgi:glutathione S-transferase